MTTTTTASHFGMRARLGELREAVRRFVDEEAMPRERPGQAHDVAALDAVLAELRPIARRCGTYAPQLPAGSAGSTCRGATARRCLRKPAAASSPPAR